MDYWRVYDQLIAKYRGRPVEGYVEVHHVYPRCLGGTDAPDNLVSLPAREHFVAHQLLAKMYGGKLVHAAWRMSNFRKYGARKYTWLRRLHAESVRQRSLGNKFNLGKKRSDETRRRQSEALLGRPKSKEAVRKMRDAKRGVSVGAGRRKSEAHKAKLRASRIGKRASAESRARMSAAKMGGKNHMFGKRHSTESLRLMSQRKRGDQ